MKCPTVHQARAICEAVKARGVIVLAFSEDQVFGASYADTKIECKQLGHTLDEIVEAIESCKIHVSQIGDTEAVIEEQNRMAVYQEDEWKDDS
jgi:hypothetical protein